MKLKNEFAEKYELAEKKNENMKLKNEFAEKYELAEKI